ncbi:MAG: pimeloyl-ACP methyl ester carboxylesterase [Candidatus Aldehydirespiratoraceae bacterium]
MNTWPEPKAARTHLGTIEYRDIGEGPVIVFVHLVLADASHWDKMPPLLADRFRCIIPTLPMGAHRVPANDGADLSVSGLARAIAELLDQLDVSDVTLVGNNSGGAISQVVAVNHPERLGRVVLTNCDMYDEFPPKIFSYFKVLPFLPGSMAILGRTLKIRALWKLPFVFGRLTNDIDAVKINRWANALLASKKVRRDARTVIKAFNSQITNDAAAALRSTELPFLLAWGADDKAFKPALAERFRSEISTAELIMIEDCKTLVCWDQPERLAQLNSDFIKA